MLSGQLEAHLLLSQWVGLVDRAVPEQLLATTERISRMLSGLRKALERRLQAVMGGGRQSPFFFPATRL
ncbi:MAG TPA: hypothetical protein VKU02_26745 [Gemmataceae bacterium]|nr:hypothetical protein [Gemmataceae bacterium]